jgi:hypothetical protein
MPALFASPIVPRTAPAVRPNKPELEATTKGPQARMLLGVFFVATMPLIFHHISATSSPKERNANGAFALRYGWEAFLRGKVGTVSALRSRVPRASAQRLALGHVVFDRRRFTAMRDPAAHGEAFRYRSRATPAMWHLESIESRCARQCSRLRVHFRQKYAIGRLPKCPPK